MKKVKFRLFFLIIGMVSILLLFNVTVYGKSDSFSTSNVRENEDISTVISAGQSNSAEGIAISTDNTCSVKMTVTSVEPTDGDTGKIIIKAELLKTNENITGITVRLVSLVDTSLLRFSSTNSKAGLFATKAWTDAEKLEMLNNGLIEIEKASFLNPVANQIHFYQNGGSLTAGRTGILFTAALPVNPAYEGDWKRGFENAVRVECDLYENGSVSVTNTIESETFNFPSAGSESVFDGSESDLTSYIASFDSPSVITIEPNADQVFTVPVVMTSESPLAGAQLVLSCNPEIAKIIDVTLSEGFTADGQSSMSSDGSSAELSFYGEAKDAKNGLTVATVKLQPIAEGISSLSIADGGKAARSGSTLEYSVTIRNSPVTVEVKKQDAIDRKLFVSAVPDGVNLLIFTPGAAVDEGSVPAYDGKPMFTGSDGSYLYLVKGDPDTSRISTISGTATEVTHPQKGENAITAADLNDSGSVNIIDAQIAYDLATGRYTEIGEKLTATTVDMLHWLKADINGDASVTAEDARAIQSFIHTQEWFKEPIA